MLVTDSLEPSGMGEHMLTLGAALGDEFDVAMALPEATGTPLLRRAAAAGLRVKAFDLARPALLCQWLRDAGTDLVHVHAGINWEGHGVVRAAKAAGLPVLRTEHLPYLLTSVVQQAEYNAMLLSVDCRIAVSQAAAASYAGVGHGRLVVVPNGVTPRQPSRSRDSTRSVLGLGNDDKVLLTVARFTPQKGHGLLVEAAPAVLEAFPQAKFVLVGAGPDKAELEAEIRAKGLGRSFLVLGLRDDVPDLLAAADLFVLPSQFEGLSLALLEAMAAGLPAAAMTIPSVIEALGPDHPYLAQAGDIGLATVLKAALAEPERARSVAAATAYRFQEQFTAERMARRTASVYRSLLEDRTVQGVAA
ncbi:MAG: glycosyltransferase family 4 protein [Devosia sp.]